MEKKNKEISLFLNLFLVEILSKDIKILRDDILLSSEIILQSAALW